MKSSVGSAEVFVMRLLTIKQLQFNSLHFLPLFVCVLCSSRKLRNERELSPLWHSLSTSLIYYCSSIKKASALLRSLSLSQVFFFISSYFCLSLSECFLFFLTLIFLKCLSLFVSIMLDCALLPVADAWSQFAVEKLVDLAMKSFFISQSQWFDNAIIMFTWSSVIVLQWHKQQLSGQAQSGLHQRRWRFLCWRSAQYKAI